MNLTPSVESLAAQLASTISWSKGIGELIDNALDAGASKIDIVFHGKSVVVQDNGLGCCDLSVILTPGKRVDLSSAKKGIHTLGRYGVGAQDAMVGLGTCATVCSTARSGTGTMQVSTCDVDWDDMYRRDIVTGKQIGRAHV